MSRVGKQIINIPNGVDVTVVDNVVKIKSSKGQLEHTLAKHVNVKINGNELSVNIDDDKDREQRMLWGTNTSLIFNMIEGLDKGFSKQLEVNGVGYKVALSGKNLVLNLGFSHQINFEIPEGIEVNIEKNLIKISGVDKQQVGQVAAEIRKLKPPEPYKGKGIKYVDEVIRRKAGKAAAGGGEG